MRLSLFWSILLVPLLGTAYADADSNPDYFISVGNSLDGLIDMIINTMNPIFDLAFNLQNNERLQQGDMRLFKNKQMRLKNKSQIN